MNIFIMCVLVIFLIGFITYKMIMPIVFVAGSVGFKKAIKHW